MKQANFTNFHLMYSIHKEIEEDRRGHTSVHCDYQAGEWYYEQLIKWIKRHMPSYALSPKELSNLGSTNMVEMTEKAARMIYGRSAKTKRRGEIGEIILHGLIYDLYGTTPVISKVYHKSSVNDTVKGFDCVHALVENGEIESLWLGEAKFYKDVADAMDEAQKSIKGLLEGVRLRDEFMLISNDIDDSDELGKKVLKLIDESTSLDKITKKICVPVLITYESPTVKKHRVDSADFKQELTEEVTKHLEKFSGLVNGLEIDVHVFVLSVDQKAEIVAQFDRQLKGHQAYAE